METRVSKVVVMEDRAQVERTGTVRLDGVARFTVAGLPLALVDHSLTVEATGARVLDAGVQRRWREQPRGLPADAPALRRELESLRAAESAASDEVSRLESRRQALTAARQDVWRAVAESTGAGLGDPPLWTQQLRALAARELEVETALFAARTGLLEASRRMADVSTALEATEGAQATLECLLTVSLEGSGEAQVRVTYLVPCAVWRPAYRATLREGRVLVERDAVVWQHTGEAWTQVALHLSTARPSLGTSPPTLAEDRLSTRPRTAEEKRAVQVTLREEAIESTGEGGGTPELPGLDDGGEARLLAVPHPVSIPSDGLPQRVSLGRFEAEATVERVAAPELSPLVSLVARFPNTSGQVLLAGPVELVRQGGYAGRATLRYTAPGETARLSFGSDDFLRLHRTDEARSEEALLTGRRTTTHGVTTHLSNLGPEPVTVWVEERVPVSEVKEVEVQVLPRESSPPPAPVSKDGVVRQQVTLAPRGTARATLRWQLSAASKVEGLP